MTAEENISGSNIYRFKEGKIAEAWQLYDVAGFLRQIGALTTYACIVLQCTPCRYWMHGTKLDGGEKLDGTSYLLV